MTLRILPAGAITVGIHHTFNEATLARVVSTMDTMEEAAHADFAFELNFGHANNRITKVDLTMRLSIDMPEWTHARNRPQAEQDEWNRFLRALRSHEEGHISICRREAPAAYRKLLRAKPDTINDVLEVERARIQRLNNAYDQRTDHGRTQQTRHGTTTITLPP